MKEIVVISEIETDKFDWYSFLGSVLISELVEQFITDFNLREI